MKSPLWLRPLRNRIASRLPKGSMPRATKLGVETLEPREVPSVVASYSDQVSAVAFDSAGGAYAAGQFRGWVDFDTGPGEAWLQGGDTSAYFVDGEPFLARYSSTGELDWAVKLADVNGVIRDVQTYDDGIGQTFAYTTFATNEASSWSGKLAKFDAAGTLVWQRYHAVDDLRPIRRGRCRWLGLHVRPVHWHCGLRWRPRDDGRCIHWRRPGCARDQV